MFCPPCIRVWICGSPTIAKFRRRRQSLLAVLDGTPLVSCLLKLGSTQRIVIEANDER